MSVAIHEGIVKHEGIVGHTGIVAHPGIVDSTPQEMGGSYEFDSDVFSSFTLTGNLIDSWENLSVDPGAYGNLNSTIFGQPEYDANYQNGLPAVVFNDTQQRLESLGSEDQPFTIFFAARTDVWLNDRTFINSDTGIVARNVDNDGLLSNLGNNLQLNETDVGNWRLGYVFALTSNGLSSKAYFNNDVFDISQTGNVGSNSFGELWLGNRDFDLVNSPDGAIMELSLTKELFDDAGIASKLNTLKNKWFSQFPATLPGLQIWYDTTCSPDSLVTGNQLSILFDKTPNFNDSDNLVLSQQPTLTTINGLTAIEFDGVNDFIQSDALNITGRLLIFYAFEKFAVGGAENLSRSVNTNHRFQFFSGTNYRYRANFGGAQLTFPVPTGKATLVIDMNGNQSRAFVNELPPVLGSLQNAAFTAFTLGKGGASEADFKLGEFGVIDGSFDDTDISNLIAHLGRWR